MDDETLTFANLSNAAFIEKLYEEYKSDPQSVENSWKFFFQGMEMAGKFSGGSASREVGQAARVLNLMNAYRTYGHLDAKINPLNSHEQPRTEILQLQYHKLDESDLDKVFPTFNFLPQASAPLKEIVKALQQTYCGKIGFEYMALGNFALESYLQEKIEPSTKNTHLTPQEKKYVLQLLNQSEVFESFIHAKYMGQKRFSLEGGETLIPVLAGILDHAGNMGMVEASIGMAHRGRLNVLANILGKSYAIIFYEFEEHYLPNSFEGSGDVKYHKGFRSEIKTFSGKAIKIDLCPNPSHLESVNPFVEGFIRAKIDQQKEQNFLSYMPILIHGDASVAGQGVVYETLQMNNLPGYRTGGTIHIVVNNQVGYTAEPHETRSTFYCTDIAKSFSAPVFHVNAEDPESCFFAAKLATEIRQKFHIDVFIDLYCYRKYGHNETDEPSFTQPLLYRQIKQRENIRDLYCEQLIGEKLFNKEDAEALKKSFQDQLQDAQKQVEELSKFRQTDQTSDRTRGNLFDEVSTTVSEQRLVELSQNLCQVPEDFSLHPKLKKLLEQRLKMVSQESDHGIDWAMAEALAFATLLTEGHPVRLSGQDSARGTFSQRHAALIDQKTAKKYVPLNHLSQMQSSFQVHNSLLSEFAAMGFELGYNFADQKALVLWEAQFGDFVNGAQVIIDQYLVSGQEKWNRPNSLVLLLPHGFEGMGPEHSSARPERFLQLAAEDNLQIIYPSCPAQIFHALRRQVLRDFFVPLIVLTPKGLLRYSSAFSSLKEFTEENFKEIIDDITEIPKAKRLLICSGKVFYDLLEERSKRQCTDIAIIRIEQLYPFHHEKFQRILSNYPQLEQCFWVQEEHKNAGAWLYIRPIIESQLPQKVQLRYVGRKESASTAAGSQALHKKQLEEFINEAFTK